MTDPMRNQHAAQAMTDVLIGEYDISDPADAAAATMLVQHVSEYLDDAVASTTASVRPGITDSEAARDLLMADAMRMPGEIAARLPAACPRYIGGINRSALIARLILVYFDAILGDTSAHD